MIQRFIKFRIVSISILFLFGLWVLLATEVKELGVFFTAISFGAYCLTDLFFTFRKDFEHWKPYRKQSILAAGIVVNSLLLLMCWFYEFGSYFALTPVLLNFIFAPLSLWNNRKWERRIS